MNIYTYQTLTFFFSLGRLPSWYILYISTRIRVLDEVLSLITIVYLCEI